MKRKLSAIAILGLVLSGLSAAPAQATPLDGNGSGTISCTTGSFTVTNFVVVSHSNCAGHAEIPAGVTSIGNQAFFLAFDLTSLTIPNSVTTIGSAAFLEAIRLTSLTIPNSVTSIGASAFAEARALTSLTIPNSVTSIGDEAFAGLRALTSLTIGSGLTSIGPSTFQDLTSLASLTIPNSVTSIGASAFRNASSLTSLTIPNSVTSIGDYAFFGAIALPSLTIPNSVTSIGRDAFVGAIAVTSLTIGSGLTSIGMGTFWALTSLTSLTIPNSVTSIGDSAFFQATSLTTLTIPNSVTSIGDTAFGGLTSLTSLTIPSSVIFIADAAFEGAGLTNTTFLGPAPTVANVGAFANLPAGSRALVSRAHIGSGAGRFPDVGSTWNRLIVTVPTSTLALNSEQAVTNQTVEFGAVPTDPQLTRAGFMLQGWSATQGGTAAFQADLSDFTMGPTATSLFAVWSPLPVVEAATEEETPVTQFSGPLLNGVDKRVFDSNSPSTMTLVGKRLHQITSATINGVKVEIQAKSRNSLILGKPGMAPGRYTLILQTRSGTLTLTKFVTVG